MMKNEYIRHRIVIFLFVYFSLFSSYYITDTFTKSVGTLEKNGNISVAKWNVSADSSSETNLNIIVGNSTDNLENQTYTLDVTSTSQVGVDYSIVLSNIPTGIRVLFDNSEYYDENNNIINISNAGSFDADDINTTHKHYLTFIASSNMHTIFNNEVIIDVNFTQKVFY